MGISKSDSAFPASASVATLAVLGLLYFGLILRNWHNIEDIRAMVVPFVTFGLFSGALLSVIPLTRDATAARIFVISVVIAVIANVMHTLLVNTVGFRLDPKEEYYRHMGQTFYVIFAMVSICFFGCAALCGFYSSIAIDKSVIARFGNDSLDTTTRTELITQSTTAIIALIGTILTTLLSGGAR